MTQIFTESGELIPVTVVEATPNVVLQVKTMETDGYEAIQVGYQDMREVLSNKPAKGHVAKANTAPKRFIREFKNVELGEYEVGKEITVDVFQAGDIIDVTGTTKGKGFQGLSNATDKAADQWLTVLVTIVVLGQWVQLHLTVYLKQTSCWPYGWQPRNYPKLGSCTCRCRKKCYLDQR